MTENSEGLNSEPTTGVSPVLSSSSDAGGDAPSGETTPDVSPAPGDSAPSKGAASDAAWVISAEAPTEESPAWQTAVGGPPPRGRLGTGRKLTRVTLGSALIAMDTVGERLDRLDESESEETARPRSLDDVLVPMSDWQEQFGVSADRPNRHLVLGMMIDARSRAGAAAQFFNAVGNSLAGAINFLLRPVQTRRAFRPVRRGFDKAVNRGEGQVARWRALGRAEDARSRALAETALSNAADETMDELVTNERVDLFIQEIIEAQTVGIADEIIEEIRERAVSSDNFFERPVRRLFRRPDRSELPGPGFDRQLVRPITRRGQPIPGWSLVGQYAGFVSRLLAVLVDVGLIVIVLALGSSLLSTAINVLGLQESFDAFITGSGFFGGFLAAFNGLVIVVGYLVLFWLLTGQTLGMMLLGVRVVTLAGGRVTFWRAMLRIIGYFLLPVIFFIGFFWILGDARRQAWHDKLAGTCVVYAWDARPDETFLTYGMYMDR